MARIQHDSQWTNLYYGFDPEHKGKCRPTIRIVTRHVDCEAEGFPHGLPTNVFFDTEEQAVAFARRIDSFLDASLKGALEYMVDRRAELFDRETKELLND
ncbi:hypothetical protein ACQX7T_14430 [Staphylococcus aureus]|uniref:hypothetical protein n=1 Tax=Staphylococcus aureus TaxID=1280 RepID=UPI003D25018B